jgi:hypothetical protein
VAGKHWQFWPETIVTDDHITTGHRVHLWIGRDHFSLGVLYTYWHDDMGINTAGNSQATLSVFFLWWSIKLLVHTDTRVRHRAEAQHA